MKTRIVTITADDYGMCESVNAAIDACVRCGSVTSTNVMVNMPAAGAASTFRVRFPGVALGLHWTLCQGSPVLPASELCTLVDNRGQFHSARELRRRWRCGLISAGELRAELEAQYRRFVELAGQPDYWNTHENVHVFPGLFTVFVRTAARCGLAAMRSHRRVPVLRQGSMAAHRLRHPLFHVKGAVIACYSRWAERRGMWMPRGLIYPFGYDKATEIVPVLTNPQLHAWDLTVEFVVHPSTQAHPELFGALVDSRQAEFRTLTAEAFKHQLAAGRVKLNTFGPVGGGRP